MGLPRDAGSGTRTSERTSTDEVAEGGVDERTNEAADGDANDVADERHDAVVNGGVDEGANGGVADEGTDEVPAKALPKCPRRRRRSRRHRLVSPLALDNPFVG